MFNIRYNALALMQATLGLVNYLLLVSIFGASTHADAYLLSLAIYGALQLLQLLSIEQFMFFYHDLKAQNTEEGYRFYHASLFVALATGVLFFLFGYCGINVVVRLFTEQSDHERHLLTVFLLSIATFELLTAPTLALNQKLLNAEMKFSSPYILSAIPNLLILFASLYVWLVETRDIALLAYGKLIGAYLAVLGSFLAIQRLHIPISLQISHPKLLAFLKNSFSMRFGHNIHNFLFTPITTNILTLLPIGFASYFYYAYRAAGVIVSVAVGPSSTLFQSRVSRAWSQLNYREITTLISQYQRTVLPILFVATIAGFGAIPPLLSAVNRDLSTAGVLFVQQLFLGLMIWQFIILLESSYVFVLIANKRSLVFVCTNMLFSFLYVAFSNVAFDYCGIYAIPVTVTSAQIISFAIYAYSAKRLLRSAVVPHPL